jgi:hypothetical protein
VGKRWPLTKAKMVYLLCEFITKMWVRLKEPNKNGEDLRPAIMGSYCHPKPEGGLEGSSPHLRERLRDIGQLSSGVEIIS